MDMFDRIKMTKDDIADWWDSGFIPRAIGGFLVVYILLSTVLAFMWSSEPELFDVAERAAQITEGRAARNGNRICHRYCGLIEVASTLIR